jgi:hypothetical protein
LGGEKVAPPPPPRHYPDSVNAEPKSPLARSEDELRLRRDELFEQFEAVGSAADQLDLQLAVAEEIKLAEGAIALDRDCLEYDHRQLMRMLGDAIAWRSLHPYTIRQLHHRAGAPPNLSRQAGFQQTVDAAEAFTERGIPVVICDLTYCLGTGDVVAVIDRERPMLIECGNPRYTRTPRKIRQTLRADAALEQLRTGVAQWPNRTMPTLTVEVATASEHIYETVERAIYSAQENGTAILIPNPDQAVFAYREDRISGGGEADTARALLGQCAFVVTELHDRRPSPRIAPPHVWPIDAECRRAVIEGEIVVGHLVRVGAFNGPSQGPARLLGVDTSGDGISVKAENSAEACAILPGLFEELLGNYQTVPSSIDVMLETVLAAEDDKPELPGAAPGSTVDASSSEDLGPLSGMLEELRHRAERLAESQAGDAPDEG